MCSVSSGVEHCMIIVPRDIIVLVLFYCTVRLIDDAYAHTIMWLGRGVKKVRTQGYAVA